MPVLDARALDRDPKGAAVLLSVLRDAPCCRAKPFVMIEKPPLPTPDRREVVTPRLVTPA